MFHCSSGSTCNEVQATVFGPWHAVSPCQDQKQYGPCKHMQKEMELRHLQLLRHVLTLAKTVCWFGMLQSPLNNHD